MLKPNYFGLNPAPPKGKSSPPLYVGILSSTAYLSVTRSLKLLVPVVVNPGISGAPHKQYAKDLEGSGSST